MRRHRFLSRLHVGGVAGRLALVLMLLLAIALAITIGWYAKSYHRRLVAMSLIKFRPL